MTTTTQTTDVELVLKEYHVLQTREQHPVGSFDKAKRWYPSDEERQSCCQVRSPSRAWPYSLMAHCRTLRHVAIKAGVDPAEARKALAKLIAWQRPAVTAPSGLCAKCGASWACEHQQPESAVAGMASQSVQQAVAQMERHFLGALS